MLILLSFVWDKYDGTYNDLHNAYLKEDIKIKIALNQNYRVDIKVLCSIIQEVCIKICINLFKLV